ncbi:twin-arginine translocase subunit TatC [Bifidobacterium longum]|uniref:twin-arginine translocase subunit TatC n=1 Tax=Bifidobacterium longum TaxID=216816 RepID=UPI0032C08395
MSTVPGNPALPAPLAPAMHPGDRDTHLDLDDLIDHSHEATQQASAGAQHPTRRWKRGVGRKSKTRKPRNPDAVMPLADHLVEFRKRFVRAIAGIIIMSIVGWMFSDQVFRILQQPFLTAAGQQQGLMSITFNGVVSAFNVKLEIAFFLGLTASCPWWSYQVWAFINPGLKRKERWTAVTFIGASVPLFLTGAGLAWYLLPQAVAILTGFAPANTATLLSADVYFDFILRMTVAFGLSDNARDFAQIG